MKVYKKLVFDLPDLKEIKRIIDDESVSLESKKAIVSLLKSYVQNLYCDDCLSTIKQGKCTWNDDMPVRTPLNDGPLESYYPSCPIRTIVTDFEKKTS